MRDFRQLRFWAESRLLVKAVYQITKQFPSSQQYSLSNQLQRAAVSVVSNIAEGCGYKSEAQLTRYLQMSSGSVSEVLSLLQLAVDLEFMSKEDHHRLEAGYNNVQKMMYGFIEKIAAD